MRFTTIINKILIIIIYTSIICEIIFFPTLENFCGCLMTFIVWKIFTTYFLKSYIINKCPFSFVMFLSMFMYRFLPLPATLIEGKPITYGLQVPYHTFFYETLLFMVSSLAFYLSIPSNNKNNVLQKMLYSLGFYKILPTTIIWIIGIIGLAARILTFSSGNIEYGDANGKLLSGLTYLVYTPFILFFPHLYYKKDIQNNKKLLWIYFIIIVLIGLSSNSRLGMITPFALIFLLYVLHSSNKIFIKTNTNPLKIFFIGILIYSLMEIFSNFSIAMLYNREIRSEVSKKELLIRTIDTFNNKELMTTLQNNIDKNNKGKIMTYKEGWDETYVNNFMLNRYCNIRITDQTLYYALNLNEESKTKMREDYYTRIILLLPTPVLSMLGINLNKKDFLYSRGDFFYSLATNTNIFAGFRVTSHVADGISTFGNLYFIIQGFLFWIIFKLLNALVYYDKNSIQYSLLGLISIFTYLGLFRNAHGCISDISFCLRGYWQNLILFIIIVFIIKKIYSRKYENSIHI